MLPLEGETLLLREMVTVLRSRDVIRRGPALVIIPVLMKKSLLFDTLRMFHVVVAISLTLPSTTYNRFIPWLIIKNKPFIPPFVLC